jgi:hypothetical protein
MRWSMAGSQAVLTLRSVMHSDRWERAGSLVRNDVRQPVRPSLLTVPRSLIQPPRSTIWETPSFTAKARGFCIKTSSPSSTLTLIGWESLNDLSFRFALYVHAGHFCKDVSNLLI